MNQLKKCVPGNKQKHGDKNFITIFSIAKFC